MARHQRRQLRARQLFDKHRNHFLVTSVAGEKNVTNFFQKKIKTEKSR